MVKKYSKIMTFHYNINELFSFSYFLNLKKNKKKLPVLLQSKVPSEISLIRSFSAQETFGNPDTFFHGKNTI